MTLAFLLTILLLVSVNAIQADKNSWLVRANGLLVAQTSFVADYRRHLHLQPHVATYLDDHDQYTIPEHPFMSARDLMDAFEGLAKKWQVLYAAHPQVWIYKRIQFLRKAHIWMLPGTTHSSLAGIIETQQGSSRSQKQQLILELKKATQELKQVQQLILLLRRLLWNA